MGANDVDPEQKYKVIVADKSHYQDESENYTHGQFNTLEDAKIACRKIVDDCLASDYESGMTSTLLYQRCQMFRDYPSYIVGGDEAGVPFSAWDSAALRCTEICG